MAYLKGSRVTGLSPKPIDVKGFTQSASEDLEGTYSRHEVLLADAFNVTDNVTISDNLILTKLSDDGNAITVTGDASTTRTISGSGSLEGSTFAQTPNASLTGMTGVVGSAVTGRGITSGTITSGATFEGTLNSSTTFSGAAGQKTAKAWINFNGLGTIAIRDSFNCSSITDNGTGDYTVTYAITMTNVNYIAVCGGQQGYNSATRSDAIGKIPGIYSQTVSNCEILCGFFAASVNVRDFDGVQFVLFGD
jgi:hypothetical protein